MVINVAVQTSGPFASYNTRAGIFTADANGIITCAPYGGPLDDLTKSGCTVITGDNKIPSLPYVTGRFYGANGNQTESFLTVSGVLYATPTYIPNIVTLNSIGMSIITGQTGGKGRCGLYYDNGAGYPSTLVPGTDSGDLTATTTTVGTAGALGVVLNPGWYWGAAQFAATSTFPSVDAIKAAYPNSTLDQLGNSTMNHALATAGQVSTGISVAVASYGAMPASFPTGATLTEGTDTPVIGLGF